jgi:hypothetical protein
MYENPPVLSLKYPLEIGSLWIAKFLNQNSDSRVEKNVLQKQTVQVPAGIFNCNIVQRNIYYSDGSLAENIYQYDYIANQGLIKREFYVNEVEVTDANGNILGTMDFSEVSNLLSYKLN